MIRLAGLCCDIFPVPGFHVQVDSCNLSWNLPTAWLENIWHIYFGMVGVTVPYYQRQHKMKDKKLE